MCRNILLATDGFHIKKLDRFSITDQWILSSLPIILKICNLSFEQRIFHEAIAAIKCFIMKFVIISRRWLESYYKKVMI